MIKRSPPSQAQPLGDERLLTAMRREPFWPACTLDIDPRVQPARYYLPATGNEQSGADTGWQVTITQDRVLCQDINARDGVVATCVPVRSLTAVIIRAGFLRSGEICVTVNLYHAESGLEVPVYAGTSTREAAERWHGWALALGLPVRVMEMNGALRDPYAEERASAAVPLQRRRSRHGLAGRKGRGRVTSRATKRRFTPAKHRHSA